MRSCILVYSYKPSRKRARLNGDSQENSYTEDSSRRHEGRCHKGSRTNFRGRDFRAWRTAREAASGVRVPAVAAWDGEDGRGSFSETAACGDRSRDGDRQNAGLLDSGDSERTARGGLDGDEIASGAALSEGRSVFAETFCTEPESGPDEGAVELSLPAKSTPDGGAAGAEGD